jgi:hypothetical protein
MKGFTLVETLITIAFFILVMGAVTSFIAMAYRVYDYTWQQSIAVDEARRGVEVMIKEIREARPGDDGSFIIEKAEDFQFVFYSNIDRDEATERVRYFIKGTDFKKGVINPEGWPIRYLRENEAISILSRYVRNQPLIFRYFDGDQNELALPARLKDTKLVRVYLAINVDPNRFPQEVVLESDVQLRNLKTSP